MLKRLHMSRRTFLKASAIGVAGVVVAGYLLRDRFLNDGNPSSTAVGVIRGQALPIPNLLNGNQLDGKRVYDLTMQIGSMAYVAGKQTATFGYNGNILGPTLLMQKGDEVVSTLPNQ